MTHSGIETVAFGLVAKFLNRQFHLAPLHKEHFVKLQEITLAVRVFLCLLCADSNHNATLAAVTVKLLQFEVIWVVTVMLKCKQLEAS